jgi:hypothetical protein
VVEEYKADRVFFSGYYNGNFTFFIRKHDPQRNTRVFRATRELVDIPIMKEFGHTVRVPDQESMLQLLEEKRIRYIVAEEQDRIGIRPLQTFRELLKGDRFRERDSVRLRSTIEGFTPGRVVLYERLPREETL